MESRADELMAEAEALKEAAQLEDLALWMMKKTKTRKKGKTTYGYRMASWKEGKRVRNMHLGCCAKMDRDAAMQKVEALGLY